MAVDVYIYNINGTLEKVSKNSTMYTTVLNKGVYVIKIFNNNTNKVLTNKICIK
ncbi:T9SS type A sorting domain-containing protein [Prevotella koreensis]|uniref:T9SS type A sorting domain-containing protein n=1 Tax=Prevotella koreensis TaxID=2490854 RepID=UPI003FA13F41